MLKNLFGSNQNTAWSQLADTLGAECTEGGLFDSAEVVLSVHDWRIVLDTYVTGGKNSRTYTRLHAPFWNPAGLTFSLKQTSAWSGLNTTFLGGQDLKVGAASFDQRYVVKGPDEKAVQEFFAKRELTQALSSLFLKEFKIRKRMVTFDVLPQEVYYLVAVADGLITDLNVLHRLFSAFQLTLRELYALNHPGRGPLGAEEAPLLHALKDELEKKLNWFAPVFERQGKRLQAPVSLDVFDAFKGMLSVAGVFFPHPKVTISLNAQIPAEAPPLSLSVVKGTAEKLQNLGDDNIGHPLLDKLFLMQGEPKRYRFLIEPLVALVSLTEAPQVKVEVRHSTLQLTAADLPRSMIGQACQLFEKIWRDIALQSQNLS